MWPADKRATNSPPPPTLTEVVTTFNTLGKTEIPAQLARWLDELDETGRWALLKLVTGGLRIGVSARLAKTAAAALGGKDVHDVELIWPGLAPPYLDLFAWLEGRGQAGQSRPRAVPSGDARPCHRGSDFANLSPEDFTAEWKWDGIRVQAVSGLDEKNNIVTRLYSRTGEDITKSFPDLVPSLRLPGALDGELLVLRDGRVQTFNVLQQRLNRKSVTPKLMKDYPVHLRAYDLLSDGENDLRLLTFAERRENSRLSSQGLPIRALICRRRCSSRTGTISPPRAPIPPALAPETIQDAVEGVMLKRGDAPICPDARKASGGSGSAIRTSSTRF
jgi:DNA ligase-1